MIGDRHKVFLSIGIVCILLVGCGKTRREGERPQMGNNQPPRLSYEESGRRLQRLGYLDDGAIPKLPERRPQFDESELGISFFRTLVKDVDLANLTLPRTYFGKSKVEGALLRNTDLSESTLCWNEFEKVDFSDANLTRSDLRASEFTMVSFRGTILQEADLRWSAFATCDFSGAKMQAAKLTRKQGEILTLSDEQRRQIDWQDKDGDQPPGG